ncbi:hypothetical protein [Nonomuraea soli]|uniref:Uncharacterized protein n=1 Tax=Nonomuraea soli TaxID=1032476 RepID=A0A7W0HU97_9ACTN|nr:hypothetical protein [Nonomuraea soli]MBA2895556.1 hypothetical protein [Nonomuraea soli]
MTDALPAGLLWCADHAVHLVREAAARDRSVYRCPRPCPVWAPADELETLVVVLVLRQAASPDGLEAHAVDAATVALAQKFIDLEPELRHALIRAALSAVAVTPGAGRRPILECLRFAWI